MNDLDQELFGISCMSRSENATRVLDKLQAFAEEQPDVEYFKVYLEEVRAVRAFFYYELLDLFARVPLVTSSTTHRCLR